MNITVLCSSEHHPVYPWLQGWCDEKKASGHEVLLVNHSGQLPDKGDILFLVSCNEMVDRRRLSGFGNALVLHASDLPAGRGWHPHIWDVLNGANTLTVTLLEAAEQLDSGAIWEKRTITLDGTELYDEINMKLFDVELALMDFALEHSNTLNPEPQTDASGDNYYRKRGPEDSELDPEKSIAEQFDLLRVCDYERFPAWFSYRGARYTIKLEKVSDAPARHRD